MALDGCLAEGVALSLSLLLLSKRDGAQGYERLDLNRLDIRRLAIGRLVLSRQTPKSDKSSVRQRF